MKSRHRKTFFEPRHLLINGVNLRTLKFNKILDDQLTISLLSKGSISIEDTNRMPASDRQHILNTLVEIEQKIQEEMNKIRAQANVQRK